MCMRCRRIQLAAVLNESYSMRTLIGLFQCLDRIVYRYAGSGGKGREMMEVKI